MTDSRMYYVDRDGVYGDASGLLIIRVEDLDEDGLRQWELMKDQGGDHAWVLAENYMNSRNLTVGITYVSETSRLMSSRLRESNPWKEEALRDLQRKLGDTNS